MKKGFALISGVTAISSMMFTTHYRKRLRLGTYGMLPTYLPSCIMPTIGSAAVHKYVSVGTMAVVINSINIGSCIQTFTV